MEIIVYKATEPYLDGGSIDMISTNIGTFKKVVTLTPKEVVYIDLKSEEKSLNGLELEEALSKYNTLQKIRVKNNIKWKIKY